MSGQAAVVPALQSFFNDTQGDIIAAWTAAIDPAAVNPRVRPLSPEVATLLDRAPQVLAHVAELAARIATGEPLVTTLQVAREVVADALDPPRDPARLLSEIAALRGAVIDVWLRHSVGPGADAARDDGGLRTLNTAIDVFLSASASRAGGAATPAATLSPARQDALDELESLLAASPLGIAFLDRDLRYVRINDALAAINGSPAAAHIGRSIVEMLPDSGPALEWMLREVVTTGRPVMNREMRRPTPEAPDEPRTYLATFFPVRAASGQIVGAGGILSDITEARRAEDALRVVQERMQSILEHTPASIWVKDGDGRIVLANHRLAHAIGQVYEQVIGRRSEDLLPPDVAAQHQAHDLIVVRENRAIEVEEEVPRPDGLRTFLSIKFPLPGNPPMVGGIATDISDRKRMEEELRVAVHAREKVLAAVSHDLRNPLSTIQVTSATLLAQLAGDPKLRRHVEIIHRSCLRMGHLITDLLDMASIGAGRMSIDTRAEIADDVLREAFELHQAIAEEKKVALVRRAVAADVVVECDRQRVLQVFENLIGNALKFCRAGDSVTMGGDPVDGAVRFFVEDTGPGISPALIAHLFDPYWSGPDARSGVGLGLYIAQGIVERHGGDIGVASIVGRGARFSFTIPRHASPTPDSH